jgi:hypothetical protein
MLSHGPLVVDRPEGGWDPPGGPSSVASPDAMAVAIANSWLARSLVKGRDEPMTPGNDGYVKADGLHEATMVEQPGNDPAAAVVYHKPCGGGGVIQDDPEHGPLESGTVCAIRWWAALDAHEE